MNESLYIAVFVVSGFIKKLLSIDYVNIYLLSISFQKIFVGGKECEGYPALLISYSLTLIYHISSNRRRTLSASLSTDIE